MLRRRTEAAKRSSSSDFGAGTGEMITSIDLPPVGFAGHYAYLKARETEPARRAIVRALNLAAKMEGRA